MRGHVRARFRFGLVVAAVLVLTVPSGCTPRPQAFFENNTDQDLVLKTRNPDNPVKFTLPAHRTKEVPVVDQDQCTSDWLVYDKAGTTLVKDPGRFCGRQTITIP